MGRLYSIQIMRAAAAVAVAVLHTLNAWEAASGRFLGQPAHLGAFGVDLFFVISGYIVASVAARATSAQAFAWARFRRVAPIYYVMTLPWLAAGLAAGQMSWDALRATLTFIPLAGNEIVYPVYRPGWTLCLEALFYTGVALAIRGGRTWGLALAIAWFAALTFNLAGGPAWSQFLGSPMMIEFGLGALIAARPLKARPRLGLAALALAAVLIAGWCLIGIGWIHDGSRAFEPGLALGRVVVFAPPAFLVVWGGLQWEPPRPGRLAKALAYLGDASYAIYLAHLGAILPLAAVWQTGLSLALLPLVALPASLLLGVAAYELAEKPVLALVKPKARLAPHPS